MTYLRLVHPITRSALLFNSKSVIGWIIAGTTANSVMDYNEFRCRLRANCWFWKAAVLGKLSSSHVRSKCWPNRDGVSLKIDLFFVCICKSSSLLMTRASGFSGLWNSARCVRVFWGVLWFRAFFVFYVFSVVDSN